MPRTRRRCATPPWTAARGVGDPILVADALLTQAGACERTQDWERAGALAGEALELYRAAGDPYGAAWALAEQGWYAMVHGRLEESERRLGEALELRRRHGDDRRLVEPLIDHAWLMHVRGRGEEATRGFLDCLALARQVGDQFNVGRGARRPVGPGRARRPLGRTPHGSRARRRRSTSRSARPPWESVTAIQDRALAGARDALGSRYADALRRGPQAVRRGRRRTPAARPGAGSAVDRPRADRLLAARVSEMSAGCQRLLV